jgi:hypothetical protein
VGPRGIRQVRENLGNCVGLTSGTTWQSAGEGEIVGSGEIASSGESNTHHNY